jgi:endonuclease/exonuclease/phosphatase family metal-dependent hydrolase
MAGLGTQATQARLKRLRRRQGDTWPSPDLAPWTFGDCAMRIPIPSCNTLPRPGRDHFRIDHCFVTTDLAPAVTRSWIGTEAQGSDHNPNFVEMDMDLLKD